MKSLSPKSLKSVLKIAIALGVAAGALFLAACDDHNRGYRGYDGYGGGGSHYGGSGHSH